MSIPQQPKKIIRPKNAIPREKWKALLKVRDKIVKEYKPEKIILFGSWAWGKPHQWSDADLFIVKETNEPSLKRIENIDKLFSRREFPMGFLVYTPKQIKKRLIMGDFFVKEILNNGKILYDKARPK